MDGTIQLLDKDVVKPKEKSKSRKFSVLRKKIEDKKLVSWIYDNISHDKNHKEFIMVKAVDLAKELELTDKSNATIAVGLRYLLFFEGIDVHTTIMGGHDIIEFKKLGYRYGLPRLALQEYDKMNLDGWYIKRNNEKLICRHSLKEDLKNDFYILESEGNVFFDNRSLTDKQAIDFVKYLSSQSTQAPDIIYNTPINIVIPDNYYGWRYSSRELEINLAGTGREFRITGISNGEFRVMSIYGKEFTIHEYDIDEIVKRCSISAVLNGLDRALMEEKIPGRIEILKKIIPGVKTNNTVIIEGKKLAIVNSVGTFHLSLADGTLHKIFEGGVNRYICVGPIYGSSEDAIIQNGIKYEIDKTTGSILSKMVMLLKEKYPDELTRKQVMA